MVVDVADGDVEHDPLEQLAPHVEVGTLALERLEDVRIGGIPGEYLVEAEHREPADHHPASATPRPLKPQPERVLDVNQLGDLGGDVCQRLLCGAQSGSRGK